MFMTIPGQAVQGRSARSAELDGILVRSSGHCPQGVPPPKTLLYLQEGVFNYVPLKFGQTPPLIWIFLAASYWLLSLLLRARQVSQNTHLTLSHRETSTAPHSPGIKSKPLQMVDLAPASISCQRPMLPPAFRPLCSLFLAHHTILFPLARSPKN